MAVLHAEDQIILGLKTKVELSDERVAIALLKDLPLILHDVLLLILKDEVLAYDLHGHQATVSSGKVHLRKPTRTQTFYDLKTVQVITLPIYLYPAPQQFQFLEVEILHFPRGKSEEILNIEVLGLEIQEIFSHLPSDKIHELLNHCLRVIRKCQLQCSYRLVKRDL